jgi:hypothetical protein
MKKIFALLAIFAFIGVVTAPASANVIDNVDKTVQVVVDDNNHVTPDQDQDKDKKKGKKATKSTAKSGEECGSVKSGCGEATKAGCGSSCGGEKEAKEKKKTL